MNKKNRVQYVLEHLGLKYLHSFKNQKPSESDSSSSEEQIETKTLKIAAKLEKISNKQKIENLAIFEEIYK